MKKLRLSKNEIDAIKRKAIEIFGDDAKVYIFGSRADLSKKGGDIDVFIETSKDIEVADEIEFLVRLEKQGTERKVDLVIYAPNKRYRPIFDEAGKKWGFIVSYIKENLQIARVHLKILKKPKMKL